jgi:hypothetical protein
MPTFRCFGLTHDNRIIWGRHLECSNLAAAIVAATQVAPETTSCVEIWLRSQKLYPEQSARMMPNAGDQLSSCRRERSLGPDIGCVEDSHRFANGMPLDDLQGSIHR